jgi:hypothetical protein
MRSETKHQHAIFDATLLDAEPAGCELLRAILNVGVGHRNETPSLSTERTAQGCS